jgi:hypothetical protein
MRQSSSRTSTSQTSRRRRSHGVPTPQPTLTRTQLESVLRVWRAAGWPPIDSYATIALAYTVAANPPLTETLTTVDFNDSESVAHAVKTLKEARDRMWR